MRIIHIVPGSGGGFYCQNCIRDMNLVRALREKGHEVTLLPMYLPFYIDEAPEPAAARAPPVFYGAISTYLAQILPGMRHLPGFLKKRLDARTLLRCVAGFTGATSAEGLEEMTLSVLHGENGRQAAELEQLVQWLKSGPKPDLIHLSNALLLGLAGRIRQELDVPIVCTLQDEHTWVEQMRDGYRENCWDVLQDRARDIAAFYPVSRYYADFMKDRLNVPDDRMRVIPPGVDPARFTPAAAPPEPPVIGFLSPLSRDGGLDTLAEAFIRIKQEPDLSGVKLKASGGKADDTKSLLKSLRKRFAREDMLEDVELGAPFSQHERAAFLRGLSVLSVPSRSAEAFGLYQIEAMACGVPVVQPQLGSYPETVKATGGGITYAPNDAATLAANIRELLRDKDRLAQLARTGRSAVEQNFSIDRIATRMAEVYSEVV